ncbi:T9SS type A sorting domain-containing protein [Hymenobacter segetis]|uniref:T9SS type A sorting domain-containing protein n=1 Tax=Hymenobacter segetis TaxID=2025509 RepID=A0ABU9LSJ8_9BACT
MNKHFLSCLGFCLLGFTAQAQWVGQSVGFAPNIAPFYIDAVDANTAWTVGTGTSSTYSIPQVARTVNAGQNWTVTNLPIQTGADEDFTALSAISASTAWITTFLNNNTGGRILRTTDGGQTWTIQNSATVYASASSYPDLIHFFSATDGLTVGDPLPGTNQMEMYTTADGGLTWAPVAAPPAAPLGEYPVNTAPAAVGNHIWFVTTEGRVFHSPDKGLTWTVATAAPSLGGPATLSFRDAQNGLLCTLDALGGLNHGLYRTTDGGATWTAVTYSGPLHGAGLSMVPGTSQYVSTGIDFGNGDQGSSYSRDNGQTWVALENTFNHIGAEFVSPTVGWSAGIQIKSTGITGVVNRYSGTALATRTDAGLQASLTVSPNPALGGRFTLQAARTTANPATVRVLDVAGRLVQTQAWTSATPLALDLSREPAGIYVLEVQAASGTARQKVVVQ